MRRKDILLRKSEIEKWISENLSKDEIKRKLRCSRGTLNVYLKKLGLFYKGNQGSKNRPMIKKRIPLKEYVKQPNAKRETIKKKLFQEGYKSYMCEVCGFTEWNNKPIPLELHHKDGNTYNNQLNNLQIVCPNCHAFTDNYRGKAIGNYDSSQRDEIGRHGSLKMSCPRGRVSSNLTVDTMRNS